MAIDYTGTAAGLFARLGKIVGMGQDVRTAQADVVTELNDIASVYTATTINRQEYLGALNDDRERQADQLGRITQVNIGRAIEHTIVETVNADSDLGPLPQKDIDSALRVLTIDMRTNTTLQSIGTTAISISAQTANSTTVDGVLIVSEAGKFAYGGAKSATKAAQNDTILAETITARCTKDARDGNYILGNELFAVTGERAVDRLDRRWPQGSGGYLMLHSTCGDIDSSAQRGQNHLTNSGFERVNSVPFPLSWTISTGTSGTSIIGDSDSYRGSYSIKFVGDGTNGRGVYQIMGQGPRPSIKSNTPYIVSARIRSESGTISVGSIQFELADSGYSQVSGCAVTRNFNAGTGGTNLGTSWEHVRGTFTTPLNLPSEIRFHIHTNVALANLAPLLIDEVVLTEAVPLYQGGPAVAIVAGQTNWELDDFVKVGIAKTAGTWAQELDRYLNLAARDIQFPTSASPTIATTLIS